MSRDTSSYDLIPGYGLLYDSIPMYAARGDVAFYVEEASKVKGRVLELGCGTGRILIPTARASHTIDGLDRSEEMLARCRATLGTEPSAVDLRRLQPWPARRGLARAGRLCDADVTIVPNAVGS